MWTICKNMKKTAKKVSEPFLSNKLPFFRRQMVPGIKISNLFPQKNLLIFQIFSAKMSIEGVKFNLYMLLPYHNTPLTPCYCKNLAISSVFGSIIGAK